MMKNLSAIRNRKILLDSNILIHYATNGFKERSGNPLRALVDNNNSLIITPISGFEILCYENKQDTIKKYLAFLNFIPNIVMDQRYFQNSAVLTTEYLRVCNNKKIPPLDLIIGGVVLTHSFSDDKLLLLTTDRNDFCEPIWETVAYLPVFCNEENKHVEVILYLLELNTGILEVGT